MLARELIGRSYSRDNLESQFCRVVGKYMAEFQKWQIPVSITAWFNRILSPGPNINQPNSQNTQHDPNIDQPNTNLPSSQITQHAPNIQRDNVPTNHPAPLAAPVTINQQPNRIIASLSQPITNDRQLGTTDQTRQHSTQPLTHGRTLRPRRNVNYKV